MKGLSTRLCVVISTFALLAPSLAKADTTPSWTGGGTSSNFSDGGNWTGGAMPTGANGALVVSPNRTFAIIDIASTVNINSGDAVTVDNIKTNSTGTNTVTINMSGGTANLNFLQLAQTLGSTTNFNMSGGTLTTSNNSVNTASGNATIALSGNASMNFTSVTSGVGTAAFKMGNTTGSNAPVVALTLTGTSSLTAAAGIMVGAAGAANASITVGGSSTLTTGTVGGIYLGAGGTATGSLTVNGGTVNASSIQLGSSPTAAPNTAVGTLNLNGGTVVTSAITKGNSTNVAAQNVNANGGLIRATGTAGVGSTSFFNGTTVNLQSGGLKFDTNGNSVTIATAMGGVGGFTKQTGAGVLTLNAANTYTGATTVSAGTLLLATGSTSASSSLIATGGTIQFAGAATLLSGAALSLDASGGFADTLSAASDGVTLSTLTVGSGGGTLDGDGTTNVTYTFGSTGSVFNGFLTLNSWDSVNDKLVFADTLNSTQLGDIILSGMIATGQDGSNAVVFAVPEPSELALLGLSGVLLFGMLRFRKVRAIA